MKRKILMSIITTLLIVVLCGQNSKGQGVISGKISSAINSEYLSNTNIYAIKNKVSVTTDSKGIFSIQLAVFPDTLVISHADYRNERIPVTGSQTNLSISLTSTSYELDEVIVNTGYQRSKPNEVAGSVTLIDNKTLNQQTGTNILKRLENVTSGLAFNAGFSNNNPQSKTNISIRGLNTIKGGLDPLIVLDNFIYEGSIENINPNDIESITVLKDAAASSIWGARASNGVIVLTTKKGKFNQKLKVEFNANVIVTKEPDLFSLPEMSVSDYIDMEQFLFKRGYFNSVINRKYQALTPAVEVFLNKRNGLISSADSALQIDALKQIDSKRQYADHFYSNSIIKQTAINLRGGSQNLAWLLSGSYDFTNDNLSATYQKMNFRFHNTYKPMSNMQLNLGVYYTNSKSVTGKYQYDNVSKINGRYVPYLGFANDDGSSLSVAHLYRNKYVDTAGAGTLLDWKYYPLEDYKHNKGTSRLQEIVASIGMEYQIFKPLQLSIQYQYQEQRNDTENYSDIESFNTRNTINLFSQLDRATQTINYIVPMGDILGLSHANRSSQNIRGQLNFNKSFDGHTINAIAGAEAREIIASGNSAVYYGYRKDPLSNAEVDFLNRYPTFITGAYQTVSGPLPLSKANNRFVSLYSNVAYSFNQKYFFSASVRKDGSNLLGVKTNEKWKPLWSTGIGWNLSKETFYKLDWLPYLKLKTTYGYSGNIDLSKSALPLAYFSNDFITNLPSASISTLNNPSLRWEQTRQINFGLEFASRDRRLSGSIDYYLKKSSDLYGEAPYDYTTWGQSNTIIKNVAHMKGKGIDVIIQSKNIDRIFKWTTTLLYNYNSSTTTKYLTPSALSLSSIISNGRAISPVVGKPLHAIAAYKWGGLDNLGNPQGYLNGQLSTNYAAIFAEAREKGLTEGNVVYIGSALPTSFGSLINTFSWKQIELSVNLSFKSGYYFMKPSLSYSGLISSGFGHGEYANRWQKQGDESITNVPSFIYPATANRDAFYAKSEINILKGDHVRLQYINLGYTLPNTGKLPFEQLQFYINTSNLGIIWRANKLKIDPDYPASFPLTKSFAIGLKANF